MQIMPACFPDAAEILTLQKLAYQSEAEIYGHFSIPPLTQTLEEILLQFGNMVILKAADEGQIVGSVRAYQERDTTYIGRLFVHPARRCQGIGSALMDAIEGQFPTAARFELFTDQRSAKNIRFYQRLGYRVFRQETISETRILVFLEKVPKAHAPE